MVQPQPQPTQEAAPTDDVRSALNRSAMGQHLLMGESVLPYSQPDSTTDGATRLVVDGLHVKLQVYSRGLGKYVTYTGLLTPASSTTELKSAMADAGIIVDGGATDLDLDGGNLTAQDINVLGSLYQTDANEEAVFQGAVQAHASLTVDGTLSADNATLSITAAGPVLFNSDLTANGVLLVGGLSQFFAAVTGTDLHLTGNLTVDTDASARDLTLRNLRHTGTLLAFYNVNPITKPTVTGAKAGNAALTSALSALANLGLITDNST